MEPVKIVLQSKKVEGSLSIPNILKHLQSKHYPFLLESGMSHQTVGRFSFIGYNPFLTFRSKNSQIEIIDCIHSKKQNIQGPSFNLLQKLLSNYQINTQHPLYPFIGGAVGFFSYDLCRELEKTPNTATNDIQLPDAFLGFYDGIIAIDHLSNKTEIIALGIKNPAEETIQDIEIFITETQKTNITLSTGKETTNFHSNFTKEAYIQSIKTIKEYIRQGDIYQINLTQRFECAYNKSPIELYLKLRKINPSPFACYFDFKEGQIISSSPERFLKIENDKIETRPIKGTRPKGISGDDNEIKKQELLNSEKEKSELLMIVDLERNDLSKISEPGSVLVKKLYELEEHPTVYHMSSIIEATLKHKTTPIDAIKATFPGGSITGTPKIRAMEIIDELEPTQRGIYTGSIGYIGFNGAMDLNIAIRTIIHKSEKLYFQVGGGIVWDSDPEFEYQETLLKAKALFEAILTNS